LSGLFASEISIEFSAPIWEMNSAEDLLLITSKNTEALETVFSLYHLSTQKFLFESMTFDEPWWISVFLFNGSQVVFQTYDDTQDIEKRTVFCLEVATQEVLWAIEDVKIQQLNTQTIICLPIDNGADSFLIDIASGNQVEKPMDAVQTNIGEFPTAYPTENEFYPSLKKFIEERTQGEIEGTIDYLEFEQLILASSNFKESDTYSLQLFVYDAEGVLKDQITLEENLKGLAVGTFFMVGRALIFVEEKRKLKICSIA